jgi:putative inorganic carbon (hco3(-)) transporter
MAVESRTQRERPHDRIAFAALLAFVVVMYTVPSAWIRSLESVRLAFIASIVAAAMVVFGRVVRRETLVLDGVRGGALICFGLWTLVSTRWSIYPEVTEDHALEILKLVAIFLTMVNAVTTPRRLAAFAVTMVLASIVTSGHVIDWYHRGEDLVEGFRGRWVGVYADPNHMAMDIGIVVPLAVAVAVHRKNPIWMRVLCALAVPPAVTAIVYSHSRGGFIGLVVAMTVWIFLEKSRRFTTLVLGGALAIGLMLFAPRSFWERNETLTTFDEDASAMGRVYAWEVAARMSEDHPVAGVGAGGFRYAWPLYAPPEARTAYVAHNVYLDVVGELGFVGLILFLIFTGGAAAGGVAGTRSRSSGWISAGIAAAVSGYIVCSLFSGYMTSAHFYLLCGLAACAERVMRGESAAAAVRERPPFPAEAGRAEIISGSTR